MQFQLYSNQTKSEVFENPISPERSQYAYMYVVCDSDECKVTLQSRSKGKADWNDTIEYSDVGCSYLAMNTRAELEPNRIELSRLKEHRISTDVSGAIVYFTSNRLGRTEQELANAIAKAIDAMQDIKQLRTHVETNTE